MYKAGFVSIVGSPNVGKSTLVNTIVGRKISIVTDKAQTTRDLVKGIYTDETKQIVFLDTPGFHKPYNRLNVYMNYQIDEAFYDIDLIIYVIDAEYGVGKKERQNIERLTKIKDVPIVCVVNKIDLVVQQKVSRIVEELEKLEIFEQIIAASLRETFNIEAIKNVCTKYIKEHEKFYEENEFYDYSDEFFVSEIIREKVFNLTKEELPHSVAVKVNSIEQQEDMIYIEADIFVERESQKAIVVGKAGKMIQQIGTQARMELKQEFKQGVYLDLRVKVLSKWGQKEKLMEMIGYEIN